MQDNSFHAKYKYIRKLGSGGCGEVYLAENINLGSLWAVKEIAKHRKTAISGYMEPEILKRLNHPALPRICDVYEDESRIYIIEDYIEGNSMKQELDANGKFDEYTVTDWGIQLCSVLEYLHCQRPNPIIYGDMKPHNIIVSKEGFVKLIDFGVSAVITQEADASGGSSSQTSFIGTKGYAAPEQFTGSGISQRSDIYSLGMTLIQLITGIDPVKSINIIRDESYREYMSRGMFNILRKCIAPNPLLRFGSAGCLMNELRQYSLQSKGSTDNDSNISDSSMNKSFNLSKIIAITGSPGTGMSTITAAMAEYAARGPTLVCIVDLSVSGSLEKGLAVKNKTSTNELLKVKSNLYYINMSDVIKNIHSEELFLHKQFSELQNSFSYIFIDADLTLLKYIQQYLNHIFIVSDMNPFNAANIGHLLQADGISADFISRVHFIINKFYKGELSSQNILQGIFLDKEVLQELEELIAYVTIFEVPYEERVYFKWIYSFFGEPLRLKNLSDTYFGKAISNIVLNTILSPKRKRSLFTGLYLK